MNRIIVPVDFSDCSEYALQAAASLLKPGGEIIVLHMLELSNALVIKNIGGPEVIYFLKLAEKRFKRFLDRDYLKGVKVTPIVKHYKLFENINELIEQHEVDLVVMGSHGVSGLKELLIGSNTEKMIRASKAPVLVVKKHIEVKNLKSVVFACNFEKESINAFKNAMYLFEVLEINPYLVYINLPNDRFLTTTQIDKKIAAFLEELEESTYVFSDVFCQNDYTVEKGIISFTNKVEADLMALPTHGRRGISRLFNGSIGEGLANHSTLPVFTFKM